MVPERGVRMMLGAERGSCRHERIGVQSLQFPNFIVSTVLTGGFLSPVFTVFLPMQFYIGLYNLDKCVDMKQVPCSVAF